MNQLKKNAEELGRLYAPKVPVEGTLACGLYVDSPEVGPCFNNTRREGDFV